MVIAELSVHSKIEKELLKSDTRDLEISNPYFLPINDLEFYVETMRNSDMAQLVEELIERYASEFNISVEDLVRTPFSLESHKAHTAKLRKEGY